MREHMLHAGVLTKKSPRRSHLPSSSEFTSTLASLSDFSWINICYSWNHRSSEGHFSIQTSQANHGSLSTCFWSPHQVHTVQLQTNSPHSHASTYDTHPVLTRTRKPMREGKKKKKGTKNSNKETATQAMQDLSRWSLALAPQLEQISLTQLVFKFNK